MKINAMQLKDNEKARRILGGHHLVYTRWGPATGRAWYRPQPGGPGCAKCYILVFMPKKTELFTARDPALDPRPGSRERELVWLAKEVVNWLEERKGVAIEYAVGVRKRCRRDPVLDAWLFMRPWGYAPDPKISWRKRWWNINREDMRELNAFIKSSLELEEGDVDG